MGGNGNSGRGGISIGLVAEVIRLQRKGLGPYSTAHRLGISYRTVKRVFDGKHRHLRKANELLDQNQGSRRCRGCGGWVSEWPCRVCELRRGR